MFAITIHRSGNNLHASASVAKIQDVQAWLELLWFELDDIKETVDFLRKHDIASFKNSEFSICIHKAKE